MNWKICGRIEAATSCLPIGRCIRPTCHQVKYDNGCCCCLFGFNFAFNSFSVISEGVWLRQEAQCSLLYASLKYHAPDTWHDTTPSHIILILGRPVQALPVSLSAERGAVPFFTTWVCCSPGLNLWHLVSLKPTFYLLSYQMGVSHTRDNTATRCNVMIIGVCHTRDNTATRCNVMLMGVCHTRDNTATRCNVMIIGVCHTRDHTATRCNVMMLGVIHSRDSTATRCNVMLMGVIHSRDNTATRCNVMLMGVSHTRDNTATRCNVMLMGVIHSRDSTATRCNVMLMGVIHSRDNTATKCNVMLMGVTYQRQHCHQV